LRAEREFPVPPLPLPPVDHRAGAPGAEDYDAVRLFIDRARAIRPDFEATSKETRDIARICRQLDGLPLAIELAAASVRLFPPKAILERLEQHLPLVAGSHRDTPARQRTLRETIAWSYDLLGPNEQRLLRRLSLFKGGWTLEAAEAVAGTDAVTAAPIDVLLATETLIEHSLIQSRTWLDGSPRFSMLETIREFGLEQLNAHEETNETHRRHAKFLMELFAGSENAWHTPRAHRWMQRGDVERENVRLALAWAISGAPGTALRLACEIAGYCSNRGAELESLRWLEQALASAGDIPDDLRAGALVWIGWHATTLGDFEKAHGANEAALAIYRRLGDYPGAAHCLFGLARNAFWACDFDQAVLLYEDTAAQFRRHDDSVLVTALGNLGWALIENGMLDRAAVVLDEALCRVEPGTTPGQRSVITTAQGQIALERGDLPGARYMLKVSVELEREGQDPRSIAQVLETCAWLSAAEGDAAHMARILGAVSALRKTIGVPVPPMMQRRYDRYVPIAQAQISAAEWEQAWSEGHALSTADAIELALQKLV
jgi:predicted ATPase